jgi:hypothetical protein
MTELQEAMEAWVDYKLHLEQGAGLIEHVLYEDDMPHYIRLVWTAFGAYYGYIYGSDVQPDRDWSTLQQEDAQ